MIKEIRQLQSLNRYSTRSTGKAVASGQQLVLLQIPQIFRIKNIFLFRNYRCVIIKSPNHQFLKFWKEYGHYDHDYDFHCTNQKHNDGKTVEHASVSFDRTDKSKKRYPSEENSDCKENVCCACSGGFLYKIKSV